MRSQVPKDLQKKLNKLAATAQKLMAEEALWAITSKYEEVIDQFYAHYKPKFYKRTHSTYAASSNARFGDTRKNMRRVGKKIETGISVSADNIGHDPYYGLVNTFDSQGNRISVANTAAVLTNTFVHGRHGNSIVRNGETIYQPKIMKPSPKGRMDKWWKKFSRGKSGEFSAIEQAVWKRALKQTGF